MGLIKSILFVIAGLVVGSYVLNILIHPGDALPRNARMGEWRDAQVRPACYQAVDDLADPQLPKLPAGSHHIDFGDFSRAVQLTAALNCYVVTQRDAICDPANRAWIVDYLGKYYGKMDDMLAAARRHGDQEVAKVDGVWSSYRNRAITSALEAHIRDGRLTKADFGWSVPKALKPTLDRYAGAPDRCPVRTAGR